MKSVTTASVHFLPCCFDFSLFFFLEKFLVLVSGFWLLVSGCLFLVAGCWLGSGCVFRVASFGLGWILVQIHLSGCGRWWGDVTW